MTRFAGRFAQGDETSASRLANLLLAQIDADGEETRLRGY